MEAHPARTFGEEARKRERVRCSSLVDWPVYPRLRRTMQASTQPAISPCGKGGYPLRQHRRPHRRGGIGRTAGFPKRLSGSSGALQRWRPGEGVKRAAA